MYVEGISGQSRAPRQGTHTMQSGITVGGEGLMVCDGTDGFPRWSWSLGLVAAISQQHVINSRVPADCSAPVSPRAAVGVEVRVAEPPPPPCTHWCPFCTPLQGVPGPVVQGCPGGELTPKSLGHFRGLSFSAAWVPRGTSEGAGAGRGRAKGGLSSPALPSPALLGLLLPEQLPAGAVCLGDGNC